MYLFLYYLEVLYMCERNKIIKKVSIIGVITNLILMCLKLLGGLFSRSSALIADSLHSAEDMLASILSCVGGIVSSKKANRNYIFGYGKAEYIFSFLISIFMIVTSITLVINSINTIINNDFVHFSYISIFVCIFTIVIKSILYIYTNIQYKKTHSILIKASKLDHRNDICITTATLIGTLFSYFGIIILDSIFAILISIWIGFSGIKVFIASFQVLMDKGINKDEEDEIKKEILKTEENLSIEKFISKPIGNKYILILCLYINNYNDIEFLEESIYRLKNKLKYKFSNIEEIFIDQKKNKCVDKF